MNLFFNVLFNSDNSRAFVCSVITGPCEPFIGTVDSCEETLAALPTGDEAESTLYIDGNSQGCRVLAKTIVRISRLSRWRTHRKESNARNPPSLLHQICSPNTISVYLTTISRPTALTQRSVTTKSFQLELLLMGPHMMMTAEAILIVFEDIGAPRMRSKSIRKTISLPHNHD
jgi:hypothetical protein